MSATERLTTVFLLLIITCSVAHAETQFTYQGKLGSAGQPASGSHDFRFRLFDAEAGGTQAGSQLTVSPVTVNDGLFTVQLDFGDAPFNSSPRWLEIDVRAAGGGAYTTLAPRQRVGASPFAIETVFVAPGAVDTAALQDNAVTTNKIADGNVLTDDLANFAVTTGKLANQSVTRLKMAENAISSFHIENGTVASSDIRDGTVSAADLAPGLYRTKADLYEVVGSPLTLMVAPRNQTVSCADANDLPVLAACGSSSTSRYLATYLHPSDWTNASAAAAVTCNALNIHPSNPSGNPIEVQASITCVSVP
jgi:hypothetical protein